MEIRVRSLELSKFKGIKDLKVDFADITNIYGENGTGKTTIVDAFMWILFDKDSHGVKNFEIKTIDKDGNVKHGLEHKVTLVLEVQGAPITLSKIFKEKWTKKRGMAAKEFTGHETLYSINEIPVKKKEFEEKIKEILDETIFKLVTNPNYFASLKWQEQRAIVQEIIGNISDENVINYNESLAALKGKYEDSVENYRVRTKATIKKLNDQIKQIPYRIDECNNSIVNEDFSALEIQKNTLKKKIEAIDEQLQNSSKGNEILLQHKQHLFDLKQEYQDKLNHAYLVAKNPINHLEDELQECKNKVREFNYEIGSKERKKRELENSIKNYAAQIERATKDKEGLAEKWKVENNKKFEMDPGATICPTCHRELEDSEEIVKKLEENFNLNKSKKITEINQRGTELKNRITDFNNFIEETKAKLFDIENDIEELNSNKLVAEQEVRNLEDKINNFEINENPDFEGKVQLEMEIEATQKDIDNFRLDNNLELKANKRKLQCDLEQVNKLLVGKENNMKLQERIKELENEERNLSNQVAELEGQLFLCEEFTRTKVELSEGLINKKFKNIKFKLFNDLINGGLEETCEILVDGVPYSNANTASQINAGIEVINTLSKHYGVNAVIFIDNAESINKLTDTNSQIVRLIVSDDKQLRIEKDA